MKKNRSKYLYSSIKKLYNESKYILDNKDIDDDYKVAYLYWIVMCLDSIIEIYNKGDK